MSIAAQMRVLYLHPAAAFGGASKSLIELYCSMRNSGVEGVVLTPAGPACKAFAAAGLGVRTVRGLSQFDNTRYGYYRRLRWLIILRELFFLPFSLNALWRLRKEHFDLLHVNEVTLLPLAILAKHLLRIPMVVHVRSLQRKPEDGWRTRWVNSLMRRHADAIVPIDHTVARTLDSQLVVSIVHNGLDVDVANPVAVSRATDAPVRVGFLGVLIPLKGIYELLEATRILKDRGVRFECVVAGENARELSGFKARVLRHLGFARNVLGELRVLIERDALQQHVKLVGFVSDVRTLYPQLDILCFPSHLDAAGRPVFEAALYSVPSVVAVSDPLPDAIVHGVTGLAVPCPDSLLIADALQMLVENDDLRMRLGRQARVWAVENFSIKNNAQIMLRIYRKLVFSSARSSC